MARVAVAVPALKTSQVVAATAGVNVDDAATPVYVYTDSGRSVPATVYADATTGATLAQPLLPDTHGQVHGYVAEAATYYWAAGTLRGQFEAVNGLTVANTALILTGPSWYNPCDPKYGADNTGVTPANAALAACVTAMPAGSRMALPSGTFRLSDQGADLWVVSKLIDIVGQGAGKTILQVDANVGATRNWLRVAVGEDEKSRLLAGFSLLAAAGTPGQYGLVYDLTGGAQRNYGMGTLENVVIGNASAWPGSYAIKLLNDRITPTINNFYNWTGKHLNVIGGVDFSVGLGDNIQFSDQCLFSGPRDVYINQVSGAGMMQFRGCTFTLNGGVRILTAIAPVLEHCLFEQQATSTNAKGAQLSIEGVRNAINIPAPLVGHCTFQPATGLGITYPIYADATDHLVIDHTRIAKGSAGHIYLDQYCYYANQYEWINAYLSSPQNAIIDPVIVNNGNIAQNSNKVVKVATLTSFDAKTIAATTLWTNDHNSDFLLSHLVIRCTAFTVGGKTTQAVIQLGSAAPYNNILPSTTITIASLFQGCIVRPASGATFGVNGYTVPITISVTTGSNATTEQWEVELWGSFYELP